MFQWAYYKSNSLYSAEFPLVPLIVHNYDITDLHISIPPVMQSVKYLAPSHTVIVRNYQIVCNLIIL
jgi:hypothetical protein